MGCEKWEVIECMLETSEERIKLLKAGISARDIEKLYVIYNDFKVVDCPILYDTNGHKISQIAPWIFFRYMLLNSSR